jgi:hypothetical protein
MNAPTPRRHGRRAVLGTLGLAAGGAPILLSRSASAGTIARAIAAAPAPGPAAPGVAPVPAAPPPFPPNPIWSPNPAVDGLRAFEGVEDDRSNSHPGVQHIYVWNGVYRYDMHARDRDGDDRQRNESKGMRKGSTLFSMERGQHWRITYDIFMPPTLHGTSRFCHIFQLKRPGPGTGPLITMSLRRNGSREEIALRAFESGGDIGSAALAPLRNKWINVDVTFTIGDANQGSARFVLRDGGTTVVDKTRNNIDIWLGDSIRPKWGIYRSIRSAKSDIIDTYLLMRNYQAYRA